MIQRITLFLGPARLRLWLALLAVTGLLSLILNAFVQGNAWVYIAQMLLFFAFLIGTLVLFITRLHPDERGRWVLVFVPSLIALALAFFALPQYSSLLIGSGIGWIFAAIFVTRTRISMEYRTAIKALRKNDYAGAVKALDEVIQEEPSIPQHYKFRAEVLRIWGKLDRAVRDYQRMTELAPDSPVAFNGLAEVYLQRGQHEPALTAARKAHELAPDDWVALYNLGMIEDRLKLSAQVVEHLQAAFGLKFNDARHRILAHLYLARAYSRLGDLANANAQIQALKKYGGGLEEWETILKDPQAATLKAIIGADVTAAQYLADGIWTAERLSREA